MPYLILKDYFSSIQQAILNQITASDDSFRIEKQQAALTEIISYLVQKYDVSQEFNDTLKFSFTATYKANQLVYLDSDAYSATQIYIANAMVLQSGNVYYSKAGNAVHVFNPSEWTLLGAQYAFFYIPSPYQTFNYQQNYDRGDLTYWKGKVYKAIQPSTINTTQSDIQYNTYADIPFINQFPDAPGQNQWTGRVPYSITGLCPIAIPGDFAAWSSITPYVSGDTVSESGLIYQAQSGSLKITPGTDITAWLPISYTAGDNRNPQLVELNVHIAVYKLSPRISPNNIPEIWVKRYDDAISWLKKCAEGKVTLDCPIIQPSQGMRIRFGGLTKQINNYTLVMVCGILQLING